MKNINQALTKGLGVWKNLFHVHKDLEMSCCRASSSVQWFVCYEGAGESGTDGGRERDRCTRGGRWRPSEELKEVREKGNLTQYSHSGHSTEAEQLFSRLCSAQSSKALWGLVSALSSHKSWQITLNCKTGKEVMCQVNTYSPASKLNKNG